MKALEPYEGRVTRDAVVQLLVYPREAGNAIGKEGKGIYAEGDYYLEVLSDDLFYQIHKDGRLMRAYAASTSAVEKTIMNEPMAVLAMLQEKLLLHAAILREGDSAYAILGDREVRKRCGLFGNDRIWIAGNGTGYQVSEGDSLDHGTVKICRRKDNVDYRFFSGTGVVHSLKQSRIPELKGIIVLKDGGKEQETGLIEDPERKKKLLLEHFVGVELFPQEIKRAVTESKGMEEVIVNIPMKYLFLQEGCEKNDFVKGFSVWP